MSTLTAAEELAYGRRRHWRVEAACRDADPDLFFPDSEVLAQVKTAKLICRGCPVRLTCLSWALASGQEAGVWGGLTEGERRGLPRHGRPSLLPRTPAPDRVPRSRLILRGKP
jgi:WhiB family transcriptional regulator, redox-sensing transcriptional regulator